MNDDRLYRHRANLARPFVAQWMKRLRVPLVLGACAAGLLSAADADLILHNAKVVTVDQEFSIQQAVAVRGGKIVAAGSSAAILKAEKGPKTQVIDLAARCCRDSWMPTYTRSTLVSANSGGRCRLST